MDIDLHVHTSERSGCANVGEEYQIQSAIRAGLGGIAITDHDALVPREHLRALNERYAPFTIFTGIEVSADDLHWGVLGIHDPALESRKWNYPDLLRFVREQGGFIYLAHPFRYRPVLYVDLDTYTPDGIELESLNTPVSRQDDIRAIAARLGLALLRNSDAHHHGAIGSYRNVLPAPVKDDAELIAALNDTLKKSMQKV
jgi:histidinol phosphatase-like PHP family hydrolase